MYPDAKWLEALKLPLKATISIAITSSALLIFDFNGLLDLGPVSTFSRPLLIGAAVLASTLSVVGVVEHLLSPLRHKRKMSMLRLRRAVRREEAEEHRGVREAQTLGQLDHLSKEEVAYVAKCIRDGSPSFYTYVFSPPVATMQGKRLVWTPGGQHHQDRYPFSFYNFVWEAILAREDEFLEKDAERAHVTDARKKAERRRFGL